MSTPVSPPARRVSADALRVSPMLHDLPDDALEWLASRMELVVLEAGDTLFHTSDSADWMFVTLEGSYHVRREQMGLGTPAFVFDAGALGGLLPFSRMKVFARAARASVPTTVARLHRDHFPEMVRRIPLLTGRIVAILLDRVREATTRDQQLEKFQALGRLSAGVAHELNNPTAAISSNIAEIERRLAGRGRLAARLVACGVTPETVLRLEALAARAERRGSMDELERSECEDEMARWLEATGVDDAWARAAAFVSAGLEPASLEEALAEAPPSARGSALLWLEEGLALRGLSRSAAQAAARMTDVIEAVKVYTHRDRGRDLAEVDVREGIDSTVALFAERAREREVSLATQHAADLPRIRAYPGDLNQVWAQLLDNALYAAPRGGHVTVRTDADYGAVLAVVADDGPGVPEELRERIFEPFFTTRDVGAGAGLGLDVARRIVTDLHGGALSCESAPGDTRFIVRLPLTTLGTYGA